MNWAAIAFDWNQVRAFLATAEEGSLSAAARALGQTQPTLGRQVAALEETLDVVLFERVGRGLTLTPSGLDLLEHVRAMAEAATRVSLAASGRSQAIAGRVSITASDAMAAYFLPPVLTRLRAAAPQIEIDVVADNAIRDLQLREADIAIRHVRPDQPDLIARLAVESAAHLYAAPAFLERHGWPDTAEGVSRLPFIGFDRTGRMLEGLNAIGLTLTPESFPIVSDNGVAGWEMAKQGLGVCVMMRELAELTPEVVQVMPSLPPIPVPIWLATHREIHNSARIRLVFDLLVQAFREGAPAFR